MKKTPTGRFATDKRPLLRNLLPEGTITGRMEFKSPPNQLPRELLSGRFFARGDQMHKMPDAEEVLSSVKDLFHQARKERLAREAKNAETT